MKAKRQLKSRNIVWSLMTWLFLSGWTRIRAGFDGQELEHDFLDRGSKSYEKRNNERFSPLIV